MRLYVVMGTLLCLVIAAFTMSSRVLVREPDEEPLETLVMAVPVEIRDLFPLSAVDPVTRLATHLIHEPLATYDSRGNLEPVLAQSWHTDDGGHTWTIHLQPNVSWHDGTPFTAADVIYTYRLGKEGEELPFPLAQQFDNLIEVTQVHDHLVRLKLRRPEGTPPGLITIPLVAQHWVQHQGTWSYNRYTLGTGPFTLKQWSPHTATVFTAHSDYWRAAPALDAIEIVPFNDPGLRTRSVSSGFAHCALEPDSSAEGVRFLPPTDVVYMAMPSVGPFLVYRAARRAIDIALGQSLREMETSVDIPATGPWPPPSPLHRPEEEMVIDEDPNALLDEIWTGRDDDGVRLSGDQRAEFTLMVPIWEYLPQLANWIARSLADIGVSVIIETTSLLDMEKRLAGGDFEAALVQVRTGPNPDLGHLLSSSAIGTGYNDARYQNPTVDLLLHSLVASSPGAREETAREILSILTQDVPAAWLYYPQTRVLISDPVHNLEWLPGPLVNRPEMIRIVGP